MNFKSYLLMGLLAGSTTFGLTSCRTNTAAYNNAKQRCENAQIAKQAMVQKYGSKSPLVPMGSLRSSYNDYVFNFATPSDSVRIDSKLKTAEAGVNKAMIEGRASIDNFVASTSQNAEGYDILRRAYYKDFTKTVKNAVKERNDVLKSILKDPGVVVSKVAKTCH